MSDSGWCIFEAKGRLRSGLSADAALAAAARLPPDTLVLRPGFEPVLAGDAEGLAELVRRNAPAHEDGLRRARSVPVDAIFSDPAKFVQASARSRSPWPGRAGAATLAAGLLFLLLLWLHLPQAPFNPVAKFPARDLPDAPPANAEAGDAALKKTIARSVALVNELSFAQPKPSTAADAGRAIAEALRAFAGLSRSERKQQSDKVLRLVWTGLQMSRRSIPGADSRTLRQMEPESPWASSIDAWSAHLEGFPDPDRALLSLWLWERARELRSGITAEESFRLRQEHLLALHAESRIFCQPAAALLFRYFLAETYLLGSGTGIRFADLNPVIGQCLKAGFEPEAAPGVAEDPHLTLPWRELLADRRVVDGIAAASWLTYFELIGLAPVPPPAGPPLPDEALR